VFDAEIWIAVAERAAFPELRRNHPRRSRHYDNSSCAPAGDFWTTRLELSDIQYVIVHRASIVRRQGILDNSRVGGAGRHSVPHVEQFASPLLRPARLAVLLCHRLICPKNDRIVDYQLRIREQKREAVAAFKR